MMGTILQLKNKIQVHSQILRLIFGSDASVISARCSSKYDPPLIPSNTINSYLPQKMVHRHFHTHSSCHSKTSNCIQALPRFHHNQNLQLGRLPPSCPSHMNHITCQVIISLFSCLALLSHFQVHLIIKNYSSCQHTRIHSQYFYFLT